MDKIEIQNRDAIVNSLDQNMIVSASAGSGKTAILVERLVSLVESGRDISKIAAITFTKKAANEFYERFYELLDKRSRGKPIEYTFLKDLGNDEESNLKKQRDREALKKIDLCFLGTIDAFFFKLISEFPLEANIPFSSVLIESLDEEKVTVMSVLNDVRSGKYGEEILQKYNDFAQYHHSNDDILKLLTKHFDYSQYDVVVESPESLESVKRNYFKYLTELVKYFYDFKDNAKLTKEKTIAKEWSSFLFHSREDLIDIKDIKDAENVRKLVKDLEIRFTDEDDPCLSDDIFKKEEMKKPHGWKYTVNTESDIYKTHVRLRLSYETTFMLDFYKLVMEELRKKGKLTFSMVSLYLRDLLRDENVAPKIVSKIQNEYITYLVDEFQDTSPLQSEIFFRISAKEYQKEWKKLSLVPGYLFVVGDAKQGIYHFRGADILSFIDIRKLFNTKTDIQITLDSNFRSNKECCEYFNDIFPQIMQKNEYQDEYPLIPLCDKKDSEKNNICLAGAYTYDCTGNNNAMKMPKVAKLIKTLVSKGYKADGKPISYKDIMVITKSVEGVKEMKGYLDKERIPCFCEGKIDFSADLPLFIKRLFTYLYSQKEIDKQILLSTPFFGQDTSVTTEAEQNIEKILEKGQELKNNKRPYSYVLESLLNNKDIIKKVSMDGIDVLYAIINYVKEKERTYEINSYQDVINLFDELDETKIERIARLSSSSNSVQVANLHKVKGLQQPVVILVGVTRANKMICDHVEGNKITILTVPNGKFAVEEVGEPFKEELEKEKKYTDEEIIRLLYVAATRAKFVLFMPTDDSYWGPLVHVSDSNNLQGFVDDLDAVEEKMVDAAPDTLVWKAPTDINKQESFSLKSPSKEMIYKSETKDIDKETVASNKDEALTTGSLVHKLMEIIINHKDIQIDKDGYINHILCDIPSEEKSKYSPILEKVYDTIYNGGYPQTNGLSNDILAIAKQGETSTEVPFAYKDGTSLVAGYIDLVVELEDKVIIVDYKTDVDEETDHSKQLNCYKVAISETTNKPVEAYIYNIKK